MNCYNQPVFYINLAWPIEANSSETILPPLRLGWQVFSDNIDLVF